MKRNIVFLFITSLSLLLLHGCQEPDEDLPLTSKFSYSPGPGIVLTTDSVKFVNNSSPKSRIASYSWDFGDDTPNATQENPVHVFRQAGTYTVVLTVKGARGDYHVSSTSISVRRPPTGKLSLWRSSASGKVDIRLDTLKLSDSLVLANPPLCGQGKGINLTLKEGTYNISATHLNTGTKWNAQIDLLGGECKLLEYVIDLNTQLKLTVVDTLNKPAAAVPVTLYSSYSDWQQRRNPASGTKNTGSNGVVNFEKLRPARYWIRAQKGIMASDSTSVGPLTEGGSTAATVPLKK